MNKTYFEASEKRLLNNIIILLNYYIIY